MSPPHSSGRNHGRTRRALLLGVGVVYLIAFVSLWVQIHGLVGREGILPVESYLHALAERYGGALWRQVPTLLWLGASDAALHVLCAAGSVFALLLVANVFPGPAACGAWACYLSLYTAGRTFLSFQWDILLLESGVLVALWAPWSLRPRRREPLTLIPLWLFRWLVVRLMFLSGAVKLLSGDRAWRDLTALVYHYETQPLPTWTSWYAHQLPVVVHKASTAVMFAIELGLPFLVFAPRSFRLTACAGFVALQLAIAATGNYGFFNLLTVVLCISLLDDDAIERLVRLVRPRVRRGRELGQRTGIDRTPVKGRSGGDTAARTPAAAAAGYRETQLAVSDESAAGHSAATVRASGRSARHDGEPPFADSLRRAGNGVVYAALCLVGVTLFVLSLGNAVGRVWGYEHVPRLIRRALVATGPFHLTSNYGLFAVMTKSRPEIVVEGSDDGRTWKTYEFRYKPGDPADRPRFVAPHMPRLDWQMWFAALGDYRRTPWFGLFLRRLLEGSPAVLALLADNPFPDRPPRYVRARVFDYRFTRYGEAEAKTAWWRRRYLRPYAPVFRR